jgi:hypothetical protein
MMVGLVKTTHRTSNANDTTVSSFDMAPSVDEADAILARFGYVDAEAVAA